MTEHIGFPSIEQFRNIIKAVRERSAFHQTPLPKLKFQGTVKLHGTNAGIGYDFKTGELWVQSRNNVITPEADNMGFARWVEESKPYWVHLFDKMAENSHLIKVHSKVVIFGEWCGQGIMKGVAISQLPKMFVIFDALVISDDGLSDIPPPRIWVNPEFLQFIQELMVLRPNVYLIYDFETWEIEIDFAHPEAVQNQLKQWTNDVEQECPVGKAFNVSGVGEGIVWRVDRSAPLQGLHLPWNFQIDDLIFKVKGEKHSDSHVKTLAAVDVEKLESVEKFVQAVVTPHRLEKGIAYLQEQGIIDVFDSKQIGPFLKWVGQDILKEESDTLDANSLERKDVMPKVSAAARQWFLQQQTR